MGKFVEGKAVQKIWFNKMMALNDKSVTEITEIFEKIENKVLNYTFIQPALRKKPLKDYTETNANYIWIACNKSQSSIRYYGKVILLHIMYRDFMDVLSIEDIQQMAAEGDCELAEKLGFDNISANEIVNNKSSNDGWVGERF